MHEHSCLTQVNHMQQPNCVCAGIDVEVGRLSNHAGEDGSVRSQAEVISISSFRKASGLQASSDVGSTLGEQRTSPVQRGTNLQMPADLPTDSHAQRSSSLQSSAELQRGCPVRRSVILQQPVDLPSAAKAHRLSSMQRTYNVQGAAHAYRSASLHRAPSVQRSSSLQPQSNLQSAYSMQGSMDQSVHGVGDEQSSSGLQRLSSFQSSPSSEGSPQSLWSYLDLMKKRGRLGSLNLHDIELAHAPGL